MEFSALTYVVGDMPEAPQVLTVKADGEARYISHTNERFPELPEIGVYQATLAVSTLRSIGEVFTRAGFALLPDHRDRMPEGARFRSVRITTRTAEIEKLVGPAAPVDPRLQQVFDRLDDLVREVMTRPQRVLRAELLSPAVDATSGLSVELQLSNIGTEELWFRSPSHVVTQGNGWLRVSVWPAVPDPGSMWSEQIVFVEPTHIEPFEGAGALALRPSASRRFRLSGAFSGQPGRRYIMRITFCNFMERLDDKSLNVGQVLTKTSEFTVP
ncbi:hypothetical protein [Sorangium sp. So ce131]|uniref:hypothetical protein n=1 Tax=Sorangium sp. So ce131 TaxID=3133282 RepID=UPI003F5EFEE7